MSVLPGTDDGLVAIGARFGIGAAIGDGAAGNAMSAAGLIVPCRPRPYVPFMLPPGLITATTVGSFLDLPHQFGPRLGYFWDITSIVITGFTAGAVTVTKNAPAITPGGSPFAVETVAVFAAAGPQYFPQKGTPLLDASERLVFTVTGALTGNAQISGSVIIVPAERISEYIG